jgi:putative heme-binding domain-containing protein
MNAGIRRAAATCLLMATAGLASPPVAPTEALSPAEERAKFKLPAGFEIQLVASEPAIQKPMNMAFDDRGRLWVTHSVEYPFAPAEPATARDGLTVLEGFGTDGLAKKSTLFADGLSIPIGVLPLPGGQSKGATEVIVWSIPNIWKLSDTDGDGKADLREVLYGPFEFVDTHGDQNAFRLGSDGWIYACHGFRNTSKVKLRGEGPVVLEMNSGNTYRFRPDGSAIEQVSWGQVNPFGMCFDSLGNQFTADCHSKPLTMILRGGYYDSFGKQHDGLGFAPLTTGNDHGSTGISGVAVCESEGFPRDYQGSMFVGNVITNAVHRDVVEWRGSSPWVEKPTDFLTCDDWWFRPVDLQIGPDGGLYVADFYNCIIGHYEVDLKHPRRDRHRGRIWRIVWKGDAAVPRSPVPPDLTLLDDEQLVAKFGDSNQTVRRLAFDLVIARAQRNPQATSAIVSLLERCLEGPLTDDGANKRSHAVHAVARLGRLDGGMAARLATDPSRLVRVHLVRALAAMPGWDAGRGDLLRVRLDDADPFVRRAAATALGEHPDVVSIAPLLRAASSAPGSDTQLLHAIRISLRNHLRAASTESLAGLSLDPAEWVRLIDVAAAVPDESLAWFSFEYVRSHDVPQDLTARCLAGVGQHCGDERIDEAVKYARQTHANDPAGETGALQSLFDGLNRRSRKLSGDNELGTWAAAVANRILAAPAGAAATSAPTPAAWSLALKVVDQLSLSSLADAVFRLLADSHTPLDVRKVAATTAANLDQPRACSALEAIVLDGSETVAMRQVAARQLGAEGTPSARDALARAVAIAPASLAQPLAVALASTPEGADTLLSLAGSGKASPRLLQDKPVVERLKASAVHDVDRRVAELTRGLPTSDDALKQLIDRVATGYATSAPSTEQGAAIFRKACVHCHRLGGEGGKIAPQLDGMAQRGIDRLLEDILDPHRNVDEAFRMTTVTTADGRLLSGLKLRDEGGDLVLADTTGQEVRIASADIDETAISPLSPMPSNVVDQVGEENLPHLLRHLIEFRSGKQP